VAVAENGATRLDLIDGEVELSNTFGQIRLTSGEAGLVEPGQAPARAPKLEAVNVIQWVLYYPGVLDPDDLTLSPEQDRRSASRSRPIGAATCWGP